MKIKSSNVLVIAALAAIVAIWAIQQEGGTIKAIVDSLNMDPLTPGQSVSPTPTSTPKASATPKTTTTGAGTLSYAQALVQYAGKRIQFDQYCQANPSQMSVSNKTKIMLDNRSGDARNISVGGVNYSLAGYGFKIITASSTTLPKTLNINCGAGVNVGRIIVN